MTTTEEPGSTFAAFTTAPTPVMTPQPINEARSNGTSLPILIAAASGTTSSSANVPAPAIPNNVSSPQVNRGSPNASATSVMHSCGFPCVQSAHCPHCGDQQMTTWSPGLRPLTPGPTSTTSPAPSWPSTAGMATGIVPFIADRSEWQTPVARILTRTLPSVTGVASTLSRISRVLLPTLLRTAAFTDPPA